MKNRVNYNEFVFFLLFFLFSLVMFIESFGYGLRGRLFPAIILCGLLIMLSIKVFTILAGAIMATGNEEKTPQSKLRMEDLSMMGWSVLLLALIYLLGFMVAIPIFLFSFLLIKGKHSLKLTIITTASVQMGIYLIFVLLLNVRFPSGFLF